MLCPTALSCKPQPCRSPAARKNPTLLLLHHSACFHTAQPNRCAWDLMPELHTVLKEGSMGQSWPPGGDRRDPSPSSHAPAEHCCSTQAVQGELYHCTSQEHPCSKAPVWQPAGRSLVSSLESRERRCSKRLVPWFYLQSTHKKLTDQLGVFYRASINFLPAVKRNEETKGIKCTCPCPPVNSVPAAPQLPVSSPMFR